VGVTSTVRAVLVGAAVSGAGACYSYAPAASTPAPGATVSLALTDAGRVALGPSIGDAARSLEGVVESVRDSGFALRMRSVSYVNGQTNNWTGERLMVPRQHVTNARERRFSRGRTALVAVGAVGGIIAFIASRNLLGSGTSVDKPGGDNTPSS
jgi:hypothetical protein